MTETPNLGLSQWSLDDLIKMADFNSDNLKIDTAVAGKISMTKLWENASFTSEFAGQVISIDFTGYDQLVIVPLMASDILNVLPPIMISVGNNGWINYALGYLYTRRIFTTTNSIEFADATKQTSYGSQASSVVNTACIPLRIYGIKGVS